MKFFLFIILLSFLFSSCLKRVELIEPEQYVVDYNSKKELLGNDNIDFFEKVEGYKSDTNIYNNLKYLFAYMPLSDFADYNFEFFLNQVKYSQLALETFPWASDLPQDIFRHYVLPPRVNNENLDTARMVFYRELKGRLLPLNLSAEEAALEINHWCHEKVIYRGTDERTISPLGAVRSGFGRCGEESTFCVTALRAAGIPARQVYTPRWAHTDDNHAWVEVWIEGEWKYMGACEPLACLNMGWFSVPSTRTMLVHTKQFGETDFNSETYLGNNANFTWINALKTYAPTKNLNVYLVNKNFIPVWGGDVKFQLYNYAEMYPLHSVKTNILGKAQLNTGLGSLEISAYYQGKTVSKTINPNDSALIFLIFDVDKEFPTEDALYFPPIEGQEPVIDVEKEKLNAERLISEDKIRTLSEADYYTENKAKDFIKTFEYPNEVVNYLIASRGNWQEIELFLIEAVHKNFKHEANIMLSLLSEKDWRDTKKDILSEHLNLAMKYKNNKLSDSIFYHYVLNPRIHFELLTDYRSHILESLSPEQIEDFQNFPEKINDYILKTIKNLENEKINNYLVTISPKGVNKIKMADLFSLKIYSIAFCRSIGVPARLNLITATAQYYKNNSWYNINLTNKQDDENLAKAKLFLINADTTRDLKYRIHFSIAKLDSGFFNTVDLGWETSIKDFSCGIELVEGKYMLLTAIRNSDESISVKRNYFELKSNETKTITVKIPNGNNLLSGVLVFKHGSLVSQKMKGEIIESRNLCNKSKATALCWINPRQEPSKHIVKDIYSVINELKRNDIDVLFICEQADFYPEKYGFPKNMEILIDKELNLLGKNYPCKLKFQNKVLPIIFLLNEDQCIFSNSGYIINLGDILINEWKKFKLNQI